MTAPTAVNLADEADEECQLLLLEPSGVINTGQSGGALTAVSEWI